MVTTDVRRALLIAILALTMALPAVADAQAADEPCALFLAARARLAPLEVLSADALSAVLSDPDAGSLELWGEVSGMACSAAELEGVQPRTMMLTLDDGEVVTLKAGPDIDVLRLGQPVAVIASLQRGESGTRELVVDAWAIQWDLPPREEQAEQGKPPAPTVAPPPAVSGLPQSADSTIARADAVEVWKAWVRELNSKLTDDQATNIVRWVLSYAQQYDVNHKLIFALIKWESWFDPNCVSHSGAIGLMQLMPGTASGLGVNPRNVQQNIQGGVRYLAEQLATYRDRATHERVALALACYNAGPNAVKRAGHHVPSITETQRYVQKVSATFYELHQAGMP